MTDTFNKQNLPKIRQELNAVLAKYGAENAFDIDLGGIRFSDSEFTVKMTVRRKGAVAFKTVINETALDIQMYYDGIKNTISKDGKYRLTEYNSRRYKMPYGLVEIKTGKMLKAPVTFVKMNFA